MATDGDPGWINCQPLPTTLDAGGVSVLVLSGLPCDDLTVYNLPTHFSNLLLHIPHRPHTKPHRLVTTFYQIPFTN